MVILLHGEMGAGKTTFVKGVLATVLPTAMVTSPTFSLINFYPPNVYHADLFRIKDQSELENIGFYEILRAAGAPEPQTPKAPRPPLFFIEWPYGENTIDKSIYDGLNVMNVRIE